MTERQNDGGRMTERLNDGGRMTEAEWQEGVAFWLFKKIYLTLRVNTHLRKE